MASQDGPREEHRATPNWQAKTGPDRTCKCVQRWFLQGSLALEKQGLGAKGAGEAPLAQVGVSECARVPCGFFFQQKKFSSLVLSALRPGAIMLRKMVLW